MPSSKQSKAQSPLQKKGGGSMFQRGKNTIGPFLSKQLIRVFLQMAFSENLVKDTMAIVVPGPLLGGGAHQNIVQYNETLI